MSSDGAIAGWPILLRSTGWGHDDAIARWPPRRGSRRMSISGEAGIRVAFHPGSVVCLQREEDAEP